MSLMGFDDRLYRNQWNSPHTVKTDAALCVKWRDGKSSVLIAHELTQEFGTLFHAHTIRNRAPALRLPDRKSNWTAEIDARLSALWSSKVRLCEISGIINAEFDTNFTRNAVIGRAHRLCLPQRTKPKTPIDVAARKARLLELQRHRSTRNRDAVRARFGFPPTERKAPARPLTPSIEDTSIPQAQRKQLIDLGPHDCRWPVGDVGDAAFFFCGAATNDDRSYCDGHHGRAHR